MIDKAISDFFDERKEAWMKKSQKSSMSDDEVLGLQEQCNELFSLGEWLPNAAKRAGQMSMATHPCTFSHPSARKNKNGYVTSIIAQNASAADGLLRSSNVSVALDALGNAAVLDVHKFLNLRMGDGKTLMMHIEQESELAKKLLSMQGNDYETLRSGFLAMVGGKKQEHVTSSKIKQVYFPVDKNYHQLSILSNSGLIFELKKRIDAMRYGEKTKELRELKRKNAPSDEGFSELYHLTTIGYGGTKPQNISVLNNQNGGKAYLLRSMPPVIDKRSLHFPKQDFFKESMRPYETKEIFSSLHNIFKTDYTNLKIRNTKYYWYGELIDRIVEKMWSVRSVAESQYFEESSQLALYQKIWLLDAHTEERETQESWLNELIQKIAVWIVKEYERSIGKTSVKLGNEEYLDILKTVEANKEALR